MAEHTVKVKLPKSLEVHSAVKLPKNLEVQSKDLEIVVRSYGNIIGTLKISKVSLDWRDAKDQKSHVPALGKIRQISAGPWHPPASQVGC